MKEYHNYQRKSNGPDILFLLHGRVLPIRGLRMYGSWRSPGRRWCRDYGRQQSVLQNHPWFQVLPEPSGNQQLHNHRHCVPSGSQGVASDADNWHCIPVYNPVWIPDWKEYRQKRWHTSSYRWDRCVYTMSDLFRDSDQILSGHHFSYHRISSELWEDHWDALWHMGYPDTVHSRAISARPDDGQDAHDRCDHHHAYFPVWLVQLL